MTERDREITDDAFYDALNMTRAHDKRIGTFEDALRKAKERLAAERLTAEEGVGG